MPAFKHRVIMLDPARTCDTLQQYHDMLPLFRDWGYNAIHWHFVDDEGCRMVFPSHPELASAGAFTVEEMKGLIEAAAELGIEFIPEIECYGHVRFITGHPDYADLGDPEGLHFNAIDPNNKRSREVIRDLLRDTAEIFPSSILHVGLDEVNIRALKKYKDITDDQAWKLFAKHTNWVCKEVRKLNKRPAMWGDHLWKEPRIADKVDTDVLIFDWHYDEDLNHKLDFFTQRGYEVWACPATMCWYARIVPGRRNLLNTRYFTAEAKLRRKQGVTGMVNTVWTPRRFLTGALDWPCALAGHIFTEEHEDRDFAIKYAQQTFGLKELHAIHLSEVLERLHEFAPWGAIYDSIVTGNGWRHTFNNEHIRQAKEISEQMELIIALLNQLIPRAKKNADRLNEVRLSARIIHRVAQFALAGRKKSKLPSGKPLWDEVEARWKATRAHTWKVAKKEQEQRDRMMYMLKKIV